MRTIFQTFSLYNVAGLVDKVKNIYYVPHQSLLYSKRRVPIRTKVSGCYKTLFNEVCPPSSKYTNINLSNWSPEDRTLKVNGTIDDFRVSRGQGLALNYCIVDRTVTDEEEGDVTTYIYHYAFFIDSVRQAGAGSVELILSVDHFTNFFYLNNKEELTEDYDPFNPVMRNCFVERQHYDRFRKINVGGEDKLELINEKTILGTNESFRYRYQYKDKRYLLTLGYDISFGRYAEIYESLKRVNNRNEFVNLLGSLSEEEVDCIGNLFVSYLNIDFKENYLMPITYGQESSVDTRLFVQGRVYKGAFTNVSGGVSSPIIHIVFPFVSVPYDLSNIKESWIKIKTFLDIGNEGEGTTYERKAKPTDILKYLEEIGANQYILTTFISKYSPLYRDSDSYYSSSEGLIISYTMNIVHNNTQTYPNSYTEDFPKFISEPIINTNDFIPAFLPIYKNVTVGNQTKKVIVTDNIMTAEGAQGQANPPPNVMFVRKANGWFENTPKVWVGYNILFEVRFTDNLDYIGFILPNTDIEDFNVLLYSNLDYDSMVEDGYYFEPILESDPYKFYSISYNETEQILHKLRYVENYIINLKPIVSYNEAYKVGLIPSFTLNGKYERYYGESIVSVISSQIPIIEDSWLNYYTVNKAQMKNQYGVNNTSHATDLISSVLTLPVNVAGAYVGMGDVKAGTAKAKGTGITGGGGLIGTIADWVGSNKNIKSTQQAKMADIGARPDTVKLSGSDLLYDLSQNDLGFHINYYIIDTVSYNSNAKYLERNGYEVSIQDTLNPFNRIGLNYIKLGSFDFVEEAIKISTEQADAIYNIFLEGVTLLHDKDYLHNLGEDGYHNIEKSLTEELPIVFRTITRTDINNHLEVVFNPIMQHIEGTGNQPAKLEFATAVNGYIVRKRNKETLNIEETYEDVNQINLLVNDSINIYKKVGGNNQRLFTISFADYLNSDYYITIELKEGQSPSTNDLYPLELIKNLYAYIEGGDN